MIDELIRFFFFLLRIRK